MAPFTVIIIGGSVAGLTLANILERYGIEYILLEKYNAIAPQLGASIGILPYGSQVLDQLGIEEKVSSMSEHVETMQIFGPDGECLNTEHGFGQLLAELTGYKFSFLDRRELIQALYDNLRDKSKVHVSKELFKIDRLDGEVRITTKDGTIFTGDIIVGADGVHSQTRAEMWRIAESEDPSYGSKQMADSITCTYRCMFGITDCPEDIPKETGFKSYHKNRSYLCQSGREGKFYFFAFIKNRQKTVGRSVPRYTAEDERAVLDEYGEDIIRPGITFGDIYKRRRHAVLVPLQEYVLDRCFYKRAILIGDSFHKFNPLTGQGGNSAIEDAALLGDLLKEAFHKDPRPMSTTIQARFADFQKKRRPRTVLLRDGASSLQALEALESPLLQFIALRVKMSIDKLASRFAEICSPGHILRYLPEPSRKGVVARDDDIVARPRNRSLPATVGWVTIMASIVGLSLFAAKHKRLEDETGVLGDMLQLYAFMLTVAVNALWTVESYRPGFFLGPLHSSIPYILACIVVGWELILPIYFIIFICASRPRSFYYPNPRAIDIRAAEYLPTGLLITYIPPIFWALITSGGSLTAARWLFPAAHLALPMAVYLGLKLSKKDPPESNVSEFLYGNRDIPYLLKTYNAIILATTSLYVLILGQVALQFPDMGTVVMAVFSTKGAQLMVLSLVVMFLNFSSIPDYSPNGFIRSISPVDPAKLPVDLQPGDKLNVCAGYGKMTFSPIVSANTQSMFSWIGSIPGIFTGEHMFRFEEIPASGQEQSRTRFVHEETFTGLLSFLMGESFVARYVGLMEDSRKGYDGFNHDLKSWVEKESMGN
ncbi:uncharacterized protein CDV56_109190 [Aspergillus thermomutatus]|uniref:FAD-binding domain-containing protein n=1 Tax=Aspergillus thermomutatus TaxID=41047 RepID=A0A397HVB6_ASPTH|nr:uncharacterized protein CDV56_109190 [Aspergillus thermomutatus]RHZ67165.1 hypothetical protein CDV56_109190 [Aspergillus thermomutatus]